MTIYAYPKKELEINVCIAVAGISKGFEVRGRYFKTGLGSVPFQEFPLSMQHKHEFICMRIIQPGNVPSCCSIQLITV